MTDKDKLTALLTEWGVEFSETANVVSVAMENYTEISVAFVFQSDNGAFASVNAFDKTVAKGH